MPETTLLCQAERKTRRVCAKAPPRLKTSRSRVSERNGGFYTKDFLKGLTGRSDSWRSCFRSLESAPGGRPTCFAPCHEIAMVGDDGRFSALPPGPGSGTTRLCHCTR